MGIYLEVCYLAANSCPTAQPRFNRFSPFFSNNVGESRYKSVSSSPLHDRRLLIWAISMPRNTPFPLSPSKTCYMCQKVCLSPRRSVPIFRPCPAAAAPAGWRHERHSLQQKTSANTRRVAQGNNKKGACVTLTAASRMHALLVLPGVRVWGDCDSAFLKLCIGDKKHSLRIVFIVRLKMKVRHTV